MNEAGFKPISPDILDRLAGSGYRVALWLIADLKGAEPGSDEETALGQIEEVVRQYEQHIAEVEAAGRVCGPDSDNKNTAAAW